ncbi:MAG TPA: urease accessory UreF family protein [Rhizomicrobium sp.]
MSTDGIIDSGALYRLMSWLSPSFPVGAFSYSHGIEYAVEAGLVRDEDSLCNWIASGLAHEFGPVSGAMLRNAYQAKDRRALADALEEARAFVPTLEFELEHRAQGEAFMTAFRAAWGNAAVPQGWVPYPSAVGIAAAALAIPLCPALVAFYHSVVSNLISAGLRTIPLGQTAGQRVLAALQSQVIAAVDATLRRDPRDVGAAAPVVEWCSIRHETQYTRLFRA